MAKLVPLLREGADDVERMLLASARQDGPPDSVARERTLAAVKAASQTAAVVGAGAALGRWLSVLKTSTALSLAVGGIGVAAAVGGATLIHEQRAVDTHPLVAKQSAPTRVAVPSSLPGPTAAPPLEAPVRSLDPAMTTPQPHPPARVKAVAPQERARPRSATETMTPASPSAVQSPAATVVEEVHSIPAAAAIAPAPQTTTEAPAASANSLAPSPPVASPPATSLRREAGLLESVRESLAASQVNRALAALDDYDTHFGSGALAEEAAVLRIEALLAAGRREAAEAKVTEFGRRYPASSYGPRVRALAGKK